MSWTLAMRGVSTALMLSVVTMPALPAQAQKKASKVSGQTRGTPLLTGSWATSLLNLGKDNSAPTEDMQDATIRQLVRVSLGGRHLRIRFSNLFGTTPLVIDAASIALSRRDGSAHIVPGSLQALAFGGKSATTIPPGGETWTDLVTMPLRNGDDVAVSMHLPAAPAVQTGHSGARANSWFVHGEQTHAQTFVGAKAIPRWFFLGGIETDAPASRAIVVMGDSITDGYGVTPGTNERWTDHLRVRLQGQPGMANVAVLNAGIGGNSIRHDGVGPKPLSRLDREVLDVPGVSHLIFLEGVNDLRGTALKGPMSLEQHRKLVSDIIDNLREIVAQTRARGIKVIGATILPFGKSMNKAPEPFDPGDWRAVNDWIRTPGNFDGVIDFVKIMADPAAPDRLRPDYDNDGLHPSIAGYRAMAEAVPLDLLRTKSVR